MLAEEEKKTSSSLARVFGGHLSLGTLVVSVFVQYAHWRRRRGGWAWAMHISLPAAAESGGTVKTGDIDGLGDVVRWASYSAGTILPSIATSVVGGGVGGAAAQFAAKKRIKDEVRKEVIDSFEGKVKESVKNRRIREVLDARTQTARRGGQIAGAMAASTDTGATFDIYEEPVSRSLCGARCWRFLVRWILGSCRAEVMPGSSCRLMSWRTRSSKTAVCEAHSARGSNGSGARASLKPPRVCCCSSGDDEERSSRGFAEYFEERPSITEDLATD